MQFTQYATLPPIEFSHSKKCYAEACISAIQNMRDDESMSDFDFGYAVQQGRVKELAYEYLTTGLQSCTCEVTCPNGLPPWECSPAYACQACNIRDLLEAGLRVSAGEGFYACKGCHKVDTSELFSRHDFICPDCGSVDIVGCGPIEEEV